MFEDGGLGIQLSISRTVDDLRVCSTTLFGIAWSTSIDQLHDAYNRLLAYTQRIETQLDERNRQLAAAQAELATKTQQLGAVQNALQEVYVANAWNDSDRRMDMEIIQELRRELAALKGAGSQPT